MKHFLFIAVMTVCLVLCLPIILPQSALYNGVVAIERKMAGLQLNSVDIVEGKISYLEGGSGPTVVLLHGFGANKDNWVKTSRYLTSDYRVIVPDLAGFGDSFKNIDGNYSIASQVRRLDEFLTMLSLNSVHLAGNSMGGYIAGMYAHEYPNKVSSLWLLNTLGINNTEVSDMGEAMLNGKPPVVLPRNIDELNMLMDTAFFSKPYIPEVIVDHLGKQRQRDYRLHKLIFNQIHPKVTSSGFEFPNPLDKILLNFEKPLLIMWGDKDRILHVDGGRKLANAIKTSTYVELQNIGHLPMIEAPVTTADHYRSFLYNSAKDISIKPKTPAEGNTP